MGVHREDGSYSASVEGYFIAGGTRMRLAKTNGRTFTLSEPCELSPGTEGELLVIVDGDKDSKRVVLPDGVASGETVVRYEVAAPF
jgi:hypothetical protein